jgi:hypothetical protein
LARGGCEAFRLVNTVRPSNCRSVFVSCLFLPPLAGGILFVFVFQLVGFSSYVLFFFFLCALFFLSPLHTCHAIVLYPAFCFLFSIPVRHYISIVS